MNSPLVSVVIAAWNAAAYLPETLVTALEQTWPNLEVILVDDGSTDDTAAAVAPFLPRIRYERRSHQGLAATRNEGIRLAKGDYIALLDADDLWHSEKIAVQVAIAQQNPHSGLIACDAYEFSNAQVLRESLFPGFVAPAVQASPTGQITRDFQRELIEDNLITCPAQVLLPRQVVEQIGPFTDSGAQDYDYWAPRKIPSPDFDQVESGRRDLGIRGSGHEPDGFLRHCESVCRPGRQERPAGEA